MGNIYAFTRNIYRKIVSRNIREAVWRVKYTIIVRMKKCLLYPVIDFMKLTKFVGIYPDTVKLRSSLSKYYTSNEFFPENYKKTIIYMADGRVSACGLSDRLRAIVSVYKLCKEFNFVFKINFITPFSLLNYLLPNEYDWSILPNEICYNKEQTKVCFVYTFPNRFHDQEAQEFWAKYFLKENYKQVHIYTNMYIAEKEYGALFRELFKPSPELESLIEYHIKMLGGGGVFISVAFRFVQLLGDFKENEPLRYAILPDNEKKNLINKCIADLNNIYNENNCGKVLVTSDSVSFLEEVKRLPFVYVIPGDVRHIDAVQNTGKDANLKLFLDYFVLSRSKKVYLVIEDQMYNSGFSYRAALLNNVPFIRYPSQE